PLEAIDVEQGQRQRMSMSPRPLELGVEDLHEVAAVEAIRQGVGDSRLAQPVLQQLHLELYANAGDQLVAGERIRDVVAGPQLEPAYLLCRCCPRRCAHA